MEAENQQTNEDATSNTDNKILQLSAIEARILACLVEKEATVPENYPLTLNSLKNACNQKSNRTPVMSLEEGEILHTLNALKNKEMVIIEEAGRATKYLHRLHRVIMIDRNYLAILTTLILRDAQTLNEIYTRSKRMFNFNSANEVQTDILKLVDLGFITILPKQIGKREIRYMHNLCGTIDVNELKNEVKISPIEEKIQKLEDRIDKLQDLVDELVEARLD